MTGRRPRRAEDRLGLIGSPARKAALEELEWLLSDLDHPVHSAFLTALEFVPLDDHGQREDRRHKGRARLLEVLVESAVSRLGMELKTTP